MSRSTTFMGITREANLYIGKNAEFKDHTYTDGYGRQQTINRPVTEKIDTCGMFSEYEIVKYKMKDGTWAEEFIQADPWHSGPVVFVGLKHGEVEFLWAESEIENA